MNSSIERTDPRDRTQPGIEQTRRELLNFLARERISQEGRDELAAVKSSRATRGVASEHAGSPDWLGLVESGMSSWWHEHPARAGALLVGSVAEDYTRRKPFQAVSIAAVAGAAIVVLRPWRMVSATAVALSLFRSSNFTGMAASVLESAVQSMQKEQQ